MNILDFMKTNQFAQRVSLLCLQFQHPGTTDDCITIFQLLQLMKWFLSNILAEFAANEKKNVD